MAEQNPEVIEELRIRRTRKRVESLKIDRGEIKKRIEDFYEKDNTERSAEIEARLQRYAKFRNWNEPKDWPWRDACFSLDTEMLTAEGWKPVGEMQAGDRVYTRAPDGMAEYRTVAYTVKTTSRSAVAFKGKSIDLLVTPNHRMLIEDWAGRTRLIPAEQMVGLPNKGWSIPLTSTWRGDSPEKISGLPAREYMRLLGWYISEGSKTNGGTLMIAQSQSANAEKCRIIERDLAGAGITWRYQNNGNYYLHTSTVPAPAMQELRAIGVCDEKVLPDHVFDLCPALLSEMFEAMLLGDGWTNKNGHRGYGTTSKALADQVQIIAQKLGLRARITVRHPKPGGQIKGRQINGARPLYLLAINSKKAVQVRKLNVAAVEFDEPQEFACVNVPPYNTLYVRRNGTATWCGNTNSAIPDMMTASMRMQDTLHNAVMSSRPPVMAKATKGKQEQDKEETINHLIDFQFFEEQEGENTVGQLADDFVNEGFFTAYTPWIRETRKVKQILAYPPIPPEMRPMDAFLPILQGHFPQAEIQPTGDGWDWRITIGKKRSRASFYTKADESLELELEREMEVFNGPRSIRKDVQDIYHPARCENLQIKSPSNPNGASHVIMRDFPTIDEIRRLASPDENGEVFYDLLDDEGRGKLGIARMDDSYQDREQQKDVFQGHMEQKPAPDGAESHNTLTRLMVFDCYDIDGDGLDEDVVWWFIKETGSLLKARYLSEVFPSDTPRRPFAEGHLFPVPGRRYSIGLLEMMEGVHDLQKQFFDQGGDAGTIANAPFGFYRNASNMKPEVIRMWPGELYPLNDPKNDVHFPTLGNPNQAFMFNMLSLLNQWQERLTTIGDLQVGRVPQGKASALRTVAGMQTVLAQGDARPERVLRRFFMGLTQIWQNFHGLNEQRLPKNKRFRISGPVEPQADPYKEISGPDAIRGKFRFTFSANVLNTSKEALQGALEDMMAAYVSPLAIQLGIIDGSGIYRLMRDWGRAKGPDPDKYLKPPVPGAMEPPITCEDAILLIMDGVLPKGSPVEGAQEHLAKLQEFTQDDNFGLIPPEHVPLFRAYMEQVMMLGAQEATAAALAQAAQGFGDQAKKPGMPGPQGSGAVDQSMPMMQGGELADESLPGAGGGANTNGV